MDIVYVAGGLAFFALSVLYVHACDRIVGRDGVADPVGSTGSDGGGK